MNYTQALEYIRGIEKSGVKLGLDVVKKLLSRLGDPQNSLKILHIAGTNGKGSVSCFLTSILKESGYRVGTFNSPSVFGYNERILLGGKPISDVDVAKYLSAVKIAVDGMLADGLKAPSAFEIEFAAAMLFFSDMNCDFAVLECGLGGKDDATNAVDSKLLAIITSISLDHTAILGDNLTEIARNKFAIVKNCPLVTYNQSDEIMSVLQGAERLLLCDTPISLRHSSDGQSMSYKGVTYELKQIGKYQMTNCALAIESALYLQSLGYEITDASIKSGVEKAVWKGRLQKIPVGGKTFLLDGAHNPDGAKVLSEELQADFADMKKCFVIGIFKDKDVDGVLSQIGRQANRIFAIAPPSPRALDSNALVKKSSVYTPNCQKRENVQSAILDAYKSDCDLIVVCGSLSILSSALDCINRLLLRLKHTDA